MKLNKNLLPKINQLSNITTAYHLKNNNRISIVCRIRLYETLENSNETYICILCRKTFTGMKMSERFKRHINKHFAKHEQSQGLCKVRLYKTSKRDRSTLICRICKKPFSGKRSRRTLKKHIRKHFAINTSFTIPPDCNHNSVTSIEEEFNVSGKNRDIVSDHFAFSNAISNYTTSYVESNKKKENGFHEICVKDENYVAKHQNSKLVKQSNSTNDNISDDTIVNPRLQDESSIFICDICKRPFESRSVLEDHLTSVHKETQFIYDRCRICAKAEDTKTLPIFAGLLGLTQHVIKCHQSTSALYVCDRCSMSFGQKISMKLHMHFTHGDGQNGARYYGPVV